MYDRTEVHRRCGGIRVRLLNEHPPDDAHQSEISSEQFFFSNGKDSHKSFVRK